MGQTWTMALFGATGALGEEVRVGLEGHGLPIAPLIPVGGVRSAGTEIRWAGVSSPVVTAAEVDLTAIDVAVFAGPSDLTATYAAKVRHAGALVVDLSGEATRGEDPLPLLWPGVNDAGLEDHPGGFALPCAAASTVAPLVQAVAAAGFAPTDVDTVAMTGASSLGRSGIDALSKQTLAMLSYKVADDGPFGHAMAFNAFDQATADATSAHARFDHELTALISSGATHRLTSLRIPTFSGIACAITLRFGSQAPTLKDVAKALAAHADVSLAAGGATMRDAVANDTILVSPPRQDPDGTVHLWATADPLHRIGQATSVLIDRMIAEDLW